MKSKLFRITMTIGVVALLAALITPILYPARAGETSSPDGNGPGEVSVQSQDSSAVPEESHSEDSQVTSSVEGRKTTEDNAYSRAQGSTTELTETASEDPGVTYTYDELGRLVQVEYPNGTIIIYTYDAVGNRASTAVYPAWDVNMDTNVNMLDVIQVGNHWGESGDPGWIREDVNDDGTINMLDVIMIGNHWGE